MLLEIPTCKKKFKVRSKSNPNEWHHLELWTDDTIVCDCIAGKMRKECRHKSIVKKYLSKTTNK